MADDEQPVANVKETVKILVRCNDGKELWFVLPPTSRLGKVFDAATIRWGAEIGKYVFIYKGGWLSDEDTPGGLNMKDKDSIDAFARAIPTSEAENGQTNVEQRFTIEVKSYDGLEGPDISFTVRSSTSLGKVFDVVRHKWRADPAMYAFIYLDSTLSDDDTPGGFNMKEGDIIEAFPLLERNRCPTCGR